MSDTVDGMYLDIADSDGFGEDHCEFVGGNELKAVINATNAMFSPATQGKQRVNRM
jgi:hypothetical protein